MLINIIFEFIIPNPLKPFASSTSFKESLILTYSNKIHYIAAKIFFWSSKHQALSFY